MGLGAFIERFDRFRRRHGLARVPSRAFELLARKVRSDHHVFRWSSTAPRPIMPPSLEVVKVSAFDGMFPAYMDAIKQEVGAEHAGTLRSELAAHGTLWLGLMDGVPVAYQFSRAGVHLNRWYAPLRPRDAVLYGFVTFEAFRGRGIAAAMANTIASQLWQPDMDVYVDCKVWNRPSIRTITKAGFSLIATVKQLKGPVSPAGLDEGGSTAGSPAS